MRTFIIFLSLFFAGIAAAQDFGVLCNEGIRHLRKQQFEEAAACFEKASVKATNNNEKVYAHANLAYSYRMYGNIEKALHNYNAALEIEKEETTLLQQRAEIHLFLEHIEEALADYNTVISHEPNNTGALLYRAHIHTYNGDFSSARKDYHTVMTLEPDNDNARLGYARLYHKEKRYNECLMLLGGLIEDNPDKAEYYIVRSDVERELGHLELALIDVERAIELEPGNANHYILQSILFEKLGKKSAADNSRRKAELLGGNTFTK